MGMNNRQRRAAKQRKRAGGRGPTPPRGPRPHDRRGPGGGEPRTEDWTSLADVLVAEAVEALPGAATSDQQARVQAASLLAATREVPASTVQRSLDGLLDRLVRSLLNRSWGPVDLAELVRRRLGAPHQALLSSRLSRLAEDSTMRARWGAELGGLDPRGGPDPRHRDGSVNEDWVSVVLRLVALLVNVPVVQVGQVPRQGRAASEESAAHARKLATVRALLAKAESTDFEEEAEALSAKAQALITQYALHHLLEKADSQSAAGTVPDPVVWRRLWLEPPYLLAKAMLVDVVADANRSRSVVSQSWGFCTVVGTSEDLDSVELLVTSLLAQASRVMMRLGRQVDGRGVSRTRSFRQSFLVAYASRIGERLRASSGEALRSTGREEALLPMLHREATRVDETVERMFPALVPRGASVTNRQGWAAGQAAGDLAQLDVRDNLTGAARA